MKVVFLFPGYGSQFVGMGRELYNDYPRVVKLFEEAEATLHRNLARILFTSSEEELDKITTAYPILFLVGYVIGALFKDEEIVPTLLMGNNIGDFAAIAAAGGMNLSDGIALINTYAQLYEDYLSTHAVAIIRVEKIDRSALQSFCDQAIKHDQRVDIAMSLSKVEHRVSGTQDAITALKKLLDAHDIAWADEEFGYEMHSALAQEVAVTFKQYLASTSIKSLSLPVMRSSDAHIIKTKEEVIQTLTDSITSEVRLDLVHNALADADIIAHFGLDDRQSDILQALYPKKIIMLVTQRSDIMEIKRIIQMQPQLEK